MDRWTDRRLWIQYLPPPFDTEWGQGTKREGEKTWPDFFTRFTSIVDALRLFNIFWCWCIRKGRLGYLPVRGRHLSILSWNSISTDLQNARSINSKTKAHIIGSSGPEITKKICFSFTRFVWNLLFRTPKYFSKSIPATKNCWSSWMRLNRNGFCSAESVTF